jgi:hypothetical protein
MSNLEMVESSASSPELVGTADEDDDDADDDDDALASSPVRCTITPLREAVDDETARCKVWSGRDPVREDDEEVEGGAAGCATTPSRAG